MIGNFRRQLAQSPDGYLWAITNQTPKTIWLGGEVTRVNIETADAAITPGNLIERSATGYKKHSVAGALGTTYADNQSSLNLGVDVAYAIGDLVEAIIGRPGTSVWALLPSGANITKGDKLGSNGDGTLHAVGGGTEIARALESINNTAGPGTARIRVEIV